jgi:hypothetical protein
MARSRQNRVNSRDAVAIEGLDEFRRSLNKVKRNHGVDGTKGLKEANYKVAQFVVDRSTMKAKSLGGREAKAASTMKASKTISAAEIRAGGKKDAGRMFGGSEFGAYRNKRRLLKNTQGMTNRTIRKTIVRDDEDITKVIRRVENQTVTLNRDGSFSTASKRTRRIGGIAVKVTGVVIGWNQFNEWRGNKQNAGYFLYPTLRASTDDIVVKYASEMEKQLKPVFPD